MLPPLSAVKVHYWLARSIYHVFTCCNDVCHAKVRYSTYLPDICKLRLVWTILVMLWLIEPFSCKLLIMTRNEYFIEVIRLCLSIWEVLDINHVLFYETISEQCSKRLNHGIRLFFISEMPMITRAKSGILLG